jgi:tRNA-binding protein
MSDFAPAPVKPAVPLATLAALDIRLGEIVAVEDVVNSNKLVRLRVSFGDHTRTILSGMKKERENLGALVGIRTLFVINLEPRKMAGEVSEGMLLDLGFSDGLQPALLLPDRPMPSGTRAGKRRINNFRQAA